MYSLRLSKSRTGLRRSDTECTHSMAMRIRQKNKRKEKKKYWIPFLNITKTNKRDYI